MIGTSGAAATRIAGPQAPTPREVSTGVPATVARPLEQPMLEGLATGAGTPVLTSRGGGAWGPAIRVAAPPEVPIITLRRS